MNILFGLFLIAHALIHGMYFAPKPNDPSYPFVFTQSWFSKKAGKSSIVIGKILTIIIIILFILSGIMLIGFSKLNYLWLTPALIAAITSEFLFILYWHKWLTIGFIINLVIIFTIVQII